MEVEEIEVTGRDVADAKLFRYRKARGALKEYATVTLKDGTSLTLHRRQLFQLFKYLDISLSDLRKQDWRTRDAEFLEALQRCNTKLLVSYDPETGSALRVVSADFTPIPHRFVLQAVEKVLKMDYESSDIEFDGGMFAKWTLRSLPKECTKLGDIVSWQIWCYNYNIGNKALRIGGGFTVLKCQNGAIGWKEAAKIRIVHRGQLEDLVSKIQEAVDMLYNNTLPLMAWRIEQAQTVKYAKEQVEKLIGLYPLWIQHKLREQLRNAHTVWDVSNAFSYVATHEPVTFSQSVQLSNHAVEVLKLVGIRR